jgi:hypothetical protein
LNGKEEEEEEEEEEQGREILFRGGSFALDVHFG